MIILSVDPGETTGYAVCDSSQMSQDGMPTLIETGVLSRWRGLRSRIEEHTPDVIVAEKFVLYAGRAKALNHSTLVVVRVLGVIQYLAEEMGIRLVEQSASVGKSARLPAKILKECREEHIRDALRHTLAYLRSVGG